MVGIVGFESTTFRLEGECSIQLSYIPKYWLGRLDSNLQVVSDQRFSRPLPHQPGHTAVYLVRPTGLEPVLAKANCPLKTACLPNSTRNAYFILKLEADGLKPSCHLL